MPRAQAYTHAPERRAMKRTCKSSGHLWSYWQLPILADPEFDFIWCQRKGCKQVRWGNSWRRRNER